MNRFAEFLTEVLARLLEPEIRHVVIGDLAEWGLGSVRSVWEISGLVAKQQAKLWTKWRPWLALLGVAGLVGIRLNFLAGRLMPFVYIDTYRKYGVIYQSGLGLPQQAIVWLSLAAAVVVWSWAAGFAFTSLARKSALVTGLLLCVLWLGWVTRILGLRLSAWSVAWTFFPVTLFLVPAIWGFRQAFRVSHLSRSGSLVLLILTSCLTALVTWTSGWPFAALERWSEGAIHGGVPWQQRMLPYLLLSWPSVWLVISSGWKHQGFFSEICSGD